MAISSVSGATQNILQQVNIRKVVEGGMNGTEAGQTEKTGGAGKAAEITRASRPDTPTPPAVGSIENRHPPAKPFGPSGNNIDVYA